MSQRTILIVDDNPAYGRLTELLLRDALTEAVTVRHATTLGAAIDVAAGNDVDCLLLDLTLPDSDGLVSLDRLREAGVRVPVVILSGRTDEGLPELARSRGAAAFVLKGSERDELPGALDAALH